MDFYVWWWGFQTYNIVIYVFKIKNSSDYKRITDWIDNDCDIIQIKN